MSKTRHGRYNSFSIKGKFIHLREDLLKSQAFNSLSPYSVVALIQIMRKFNGNNNGIIICTVCELAKTNFMGRTTAQKSLRELEQKGFIIKTGQGAFTSRLASTWELSMYKNKCETRACDKWKEWEPGLDFTNRETVPWAEPIPRHKTK